MNQTEQPPSAGNSDACVTNSASPLEESKTRQTKSEFLLVPAGGKPLPTSARPCGGRREGGEERRQQAGWCNGTSEKARYEARTQTIAAHEFDKDDTKGTCYVYQALFYATAA